MSDRVAVITDVHANLPALRGALARIDELAIGRIFCGGDLVGYGPQPNEVCALIAERSIPTIYGNYDYAIARDHDDCGCAYITPEDRELGRRSIDWTLEHTDASSKDFMRELPFDLRFAVGADVRSPRARVAAQGQRVPVRGQAGLALRAPRSGGERGRARRSGTRTSRGCAATAACCSSTAAPSASPRTAIRAARSRCSRPAGGGVEVTIERVDYDAAAVAPRSARPGSRPSSPRSCCWRPERRRRTSRAVP